MKQVLHAWIGHGEEAAIEPKGFLPGSFAVYIKMFDEPGNRKLVITCTNKCLELSFPEPVLNIKQG